MPNSRAPYLIERILSAGSYLTSGMIGFIWLIIAALTKKRITPFLMYHIMQSIFLSILVFVVYKLLGLCYIIVGKIPIINNIPLIFLSPIPFLYDFSLLQLFTTAVLLYLVITSALGYYSYIPWVSDIIKGNTGTR